MRTLIQGEEGERERGRGGRGGESDPGQGHWISMVRSCHFWKCSISGMASSAVRADRMRQLECDTSEQNPKSTTLVNPLLIYTELPPRQSPKRPVWPECKCLSTESTIDPSSSHTVGQRSKLLADDHWEPLDKSIRSITHWKCAF